MSSSVRGKGFKEKRFQFYLMLYSISTLSVVGILAMFAIMESDPGFLGLLIFYFLFSFKFLPPVFLEARRGDAFIPATRQLGLDFKRVDSYNLHDMFDHLLVLSSGNTRKAYNVIDGMYRGYSVYYFDYQSIDGYGKISEVRDSSALILELPRNFPELVIRPTATFNLYKNLAGHKPMRFNHPVFDSQYTVKTRSMTLANNIFHPRMIELFLRMASTGINMEINRKTMIIYFSNRIKPETLAWHLDALFTIRQMLPQKLFRE